MQRRGILFDQNKDDLDCPRVTATQGIVLATPGNQTSEGVGWAWFSVMAIEEARRR